MATRHQFTRKMLDRKIIEAERLSGEPLPADLTLRVKHMIVSHHGSNEFGSPTVPMTLEAIALHHLDNLDAKIHQVRRHLAEDDSPGRFTSMNKRLDRSLFKPPAS